MKLKVLLIYLDISAKLGIIPYLSAVFSPYLEFDSVLADELDAGSASQYELILFSSERCMSRTAGLLEPYGVPMYQCVRELNYTHIHKLLEIPALSKVCIVSDQKPHCEEILESLTRLGFTQYIYTIYYPGCEPPDPTFQHAVTPGETRYVPATIRNVVDIGNRGVDMATLCYIIKLFGLPETLLNHVSNNYAEYVSSFMRHMNFQSEDTTRYFIVRDKLLDAMDLGMCVVDEEGRIQMLNQVFCRFLGRNRTLAKNESLPGLLGEMGVQKSLNELLWGEAVCVELSESESVRLSFASSFESSVRDTRFLFLLEPISSPFRLTAPSWKQGTRFKSRPDFSGQNSLFFRRLSDSKNRRIEFIVRTALSYAESDFPVLLLGEPGLCQLELARFIHINSLRAERPFYFLDAGHPFLTAGFQDGLKTIGSLEELERLMTEGNSFTMFIDHLERTSRELQNFLCAVLNRLENRNRQFKLVCAFQGDTKELLASGDFLPELFFQLSTLTLKLPALREMRNAIPSFYDYVFGELFLCDSQRVETMFTRQLFDFLMNYDYPGNFKELENLCHYFYYNFNGKKLTLAQLPSYIQCIPLPKESLTPMEREVLEIVKSYPHSGRNRIHVLLSARGIDLTPHQIRTILAGLSDKTYVRILKTKQGCEITELGEYVLQRCDL